MRPRSSGSGGGGGGTRGKTTDIFRSFPLLLLSVAALVVCFCSNEVHGQGGLGMFFDSTDLCMTVPGNGICVNSQYGTKVFAPDGIEDKLAGFWKFDDPYGLDSSGNSLHARLPPRQFAPGQTPGGFSLKLTPVDFVEIPHSPVLMSQTFTATFWIYLLDDANGAWRSVFRKGNDSSDMTPTLLLWPKSRRMRVVISSSEQPEELLDSVGELTLRRWTHLGVVINSGLLRLYVNGMLDNQHVSRGIPRLNTGDFFLGQTPYHTGITAFVDDFRLYSRVLSESEIRAQAAFALGQVGPEYSRFGCAECDYFSAVNSCDDGYHLCAYKELYAGGFLVARVQGWINGDSRVWAKDCHDDSDFSSKRVAICCVNV